MAPHLSRQPRARHLTIELHLGYFFHNKSQEMAEETIDTIQFRRILARNVALPLLLSVLSAAVFVAIIAYLLSELNAVEHSEQVIGKANQVAKLAADEESGLRGYLLSGDQAFLEPYLVASPRLPVEVETL